MLKIVGTTLAAVALMAATAHANPANMIRKDVQVVYSDLDLSTDGGARQLLGRIELAANEACGGSPLFYSSYSVAPSLAAKEFNTCRAGAITTAVKSLPFPTVQKLSTSADSPLRFAKE
jgi:UrcA family protein